MSGDQHYTDAEIELIYRVHRSDDNNRHLAALLGRSPDAIDWVQRTLGEADGIGPRGSRYLGAQAWLVRARLGDAERGRITRLDVTT